MREPGLVEQGREREEGQPPARGGRPETAQRASCSEAVAGVVTDTQCVGNPGLGIVREMMSLEVGGVCPPASLTD